MMKMENEVCLRKAIHLRENRLNTGASCKIYVAHSTPNTKSTHLEKSTSYDENEKSYSEWKLCAKHFKIFILVLIWIVCSISLMANRVTVQDMHQISIPKNQTQSYIILKKPNNNQIRLMLEGALLPSYYGNLSEHWMTIWIQLIVVNELPRASASIKPSTIVLLQNVSETWYVPLVTEKLIGVVPEVEYQKVFKLSAHKIDNTSYNVLQIQFKTNLKTNFPISMGYNLEPINTDDGIIYAGAILIGLYILIIFEIIHRTLAAMLASTMSLAILASYNARPTMTEIISWIDVETMLLLFSMMILVTILSETGIFDYMSVLAYKLTGGQVWPLLNSLCFIATILACFLDNVTTALLITPVTLKLCEVVKLDPVPILTFTLLFSNIGGAITPIGDPPNVIIASNKDVIKAGINFGVFTMHMSIGVLLAIIVVYIQLRLLNMDVSHLRIQEPAEVQDLKREIAVWKRTAASMSSYSKDEEHVKVSLLKKSEKLRSILKNTLNNTTITEESFATTVKELETKYPIKDKVLLIKSGIVLFLVICVFFLHSVPATSRLGLGWTALLGALLLLLLYDKESIEGIFSRVEWVTLLFFASLFILMEALSRLGLIELIGKQTQYIVMSVGPESRLAIAIILMLWVSGIASAFVDNLPLTTMMIRVATDLSNNRELNLPLPPLIWALSFGACFGGNGTLFGSSSNIVCAGVAEQHGYQFTFMRFFKVGFPVMISSLLVVTIYLIICHVVLEWH